MGEMGKLPRVAPVGLSYEPLRESAGEIAQCPNRYIGSFKRHLHGWRQQGSEGARFAICDIGAVQDIHSAFVNQP